MRSVFANVKYPSLLNLHTNGHRGLRTGWGCCSFIGRELSSAVRQHLKLERDEAV